MSVGRGGSELGKGDGSVRGWASEMGWRGGGIEKNMRGKGERSEECEKREELGIGNKKGREKCVCVWARTPFAVPMWPSFAIF